jgi:hypothetical protein
VEHLLVQIDAPVAAAFLDDLERHQEFQAVGRTHEEVQTPDVA